MLLATSAMGRSKTETMDLDAIHEKYGIEPKQLIEVKSLMGDTSDNIPGVKGIGEKTAMTLVKNFGTLDNVYDHLDSPIIKPRQRENLLACRRMPTSATRWAPSAPMLPSTQRKGPTR